VTPIRSARGNLENRERNRALSITAESASTATIENRYTVGTLSYTKTGLYWLFVWLLWGDFCFTLMESVVPSLLPLMLKDHGASNKEISIIVGTIATALNTVVGPICSYRSDRHRSRFGRRIPFLIWPTPFIVLFLMLLPYAPEIAKWLMQVEWVAGLFSHSPVTPVIFLFGLLTVCFQLFNMVVATIYWYLFNDVVPVHYLGRFFALVRVVGTLAGFCFQYFIFGLAESHMKEIWIGLGLLYGGAFTLMCWRVKEGGYPPVTGEERGSVLGDVRNYFRQCFSHRLYLWFYLAYGLYVWSTVAQVFWVFFFRDQLKMDLDTIGKYRSWSLLLVIPLAYPFGLLVDRWRSQRVIMLATALCAAMNFAAFAFIQDKWSYMVCMILWNVPVFMINVANAVWFPELLPRARFGQFASAAALTSAGVTMVMSPFCGWLFDQIQNYRYVFVWAGVMQTISFLTLIPVYRAWIRHGGPDNYLAPGDVRVEREKPSHA